MGHLLKHSCNKSVFLIFSTDKNECAIFTGMCGKGVCQNTPGSYRCLCADGYKDTPDQSPRCQGNDILIQMIFMKISMAEKRTSDGLLTSKITCCFSNQLAFLTNRPDSRVWHLHRDFNKTTIGRTILNHSCMCEISSSSAMLGKLVNKTRANSCRNSNSQTLTNVIFVSCIV